ncbi:zinc protease YmxG [gut metagenome]|uniref:Zinc protease YmxG n=1 Tax=gut metagenome TaxID=749906 RepID=J9G6W1_9ZZZZ
MKTYHTHTLNNGLRIIHEHCDSEVVYCGYVICAGTRHEEAHDYGMAHFIEHMSFKGTERRKAVHITNGLERVGGDLNAFTNKQETVYYATILRPDFPRAVDLLTDIVFHSTYPQHEIDKEVEVICDEIDSYKDSPSEIIFDEFEALLYNNHELGRDILGDPQRLRSYTTADALRFTQKYYRPENAVFYVYGNLDFNKVVKILEKAQTDKAETTATPIIPTPPALQLPQPLTGVHTRTKETHQAHVLTGALTFGGKDDRRFGLLLLNNMLGGPGMNSRLNMSLRERAGLVYSVDAYLNTYPDIGHWNIYFGCDPKDVNRCLKLIDKELKRFVNQPLSASQLAAAKKQLRGQIGISCDAFESYSLALGKTFAHYNSYRDVENLYQALEEVTAEELQQIAAEIYHPERITTLIYSPE